MSAIVEPLPGQVIAAFGNPHHAMEFLKYTVGQDDYTITAAVDGLLMWEVRRRRAESAAASPSGADSVAPAPTVPETGARFSRALR